MTQCVGLYKANYMAIHLSLSLDLNILTWCRYSESHDAEPIIHRSQQSDIRSTIRARTIIYIIIIIIIIVSYTFALLPHYEWASFYVPV